MTREEPQSSHGRSDWRLAVLGLMLSALLFWLATRKLDWAESWRAVEGVDWTLLLLALALQSATYPLGAVRWRALFPSPALVPFGRLAAALLVAQLINVAFPVRLGPLVRVYLLGGRSGREKAVSLMTVAGEKVLDLLALVIGVGALVILFPLPDWPVQASRWALLLAAAGLAAVLLAKGGRRWFEGWLLRFGGRVMGAGRTMLEGVDVWLQPARAGQLLSLTAGMWLIGVAVNMLLFRSLGLPARFSVAVVLLLLLQLGARVPGAPGNVGIFESLCVVGLGWFGISGGVALGYGLLLHAVILLPGLIGGTITILCSSAAREGARMATGRGRGAE